MKTPQEIQALQTKLISQIERANNLAKSSKTFTEGNYWSMYADQLEHKLNVVNYILENTVDTIADWEISGMKDFDSNRYLN